MTHPAEAKAQDFSRQLETLFAEASPWLHAPDLEARILGRIRRRRRMRTLILGLGALTGIAVAARGLAEARLPVFPAWRLSDQLAGNSAIDLLYAAVGAGGIAPAVIAGGATLLGLAFARILEEV
ncbi:MAG: hypothetical protein IM653_12450 [Phenylobacterium sp.]|uniref:hypothetical protein n=1 Tax=Phenylobacterium sp. TaxID=1871053 RepID=UPI0025EFFC32|nr:hypothetical protein [Phenylobacterium sp.]MCA6223335.1 hypothetical protein [Phenylobacterium sp.]MCA6225497.1 hypothetical protein [Phenylobacterium sp.]MCA6233204.1 hypothetical protein [Phenylobacterium sp.]MCA6235929.1 hypothetical protein [Phenylobacterium sp.]MCA6248607.1 hypothetical protein [Phenylobacterium sp.]